MHVKQMERKYPDACVLVMGDFNQLPLKLDGYYQVVKSHTRNNKILDKCYTKVKNGYTQCRQLAKLANCDAACSFLHSSIKKQTSKTHTPRLFGGKL